jgi:hypothetical protein
VVVVVAVVISDTMVEYDKNAIGMRSGTGLGGGYLWRIV